MPADRKCWDDVEVRSVDDVQRSVDAAAKVGVDAGNAVTPSTGPPTSDGVLYILHMGDGTIPTVRKN